MAKKSIVTSIRLNDDDFLKIKELKKKYNVSWTKLIAHANKLLAEDIKNKTEDKK